MNISSIQERFYRKKILGGWPLIIWQATTSRITVSNCPVLSNLCTVIILKIGGWAGQDWGGPWRRAPWPQHRTATGSILLISCVTHHYCPSVHLRSSSVVCFLPASCVRICSGFRFAVAAPTIWNTLPHPLAMHSQQRFHSPFSSPTQNFFLFYNLAFQPP